MDEHVKVAAGAVLGSFSNFAPVARRRSTAAEGRGHGRRRGAGRDRASPETGRSRSPGSAAPTARSGSLRTGTITAVSCSCRE